MSFLLKKPNFSFHTILVQNLGMNEAIVLQHLDDLLGKKWIERDGYRWFYHTYEEWQQQFPFWSKRKVFGTFRKLEEDGYIISSKSYNKMRIDKTKWYRINYEKLHREFPNLFQTNNVKFLQQPNGNSCNTESQNVQQGNGNPSDMESQSVPQGNGNPNDTESQNVPQGNRNLNDMESQNVPQGNGNPSDTESQNVQQGYRNTSDNGVANAATTITKEIIKEIEKEEKENKLTIENHTHLYEIVHYLNQKANKRFNPNSHSVKEPILERLKEGYALEDLKYVVDLKVSQWLDDLKMNPYLRPSTLFSTKNFENYLNEPKEIPNQPSKQIFQSIQLDYTDGEDS